MNGRILAVDDPRIAEIPVHPNCKCYIESLSSIVAGTATDAGTDGVDLYVALHGVLPNNYLTQAEAKAAGWNKLLGNLTEVLPGRMIGGDVFENRKHKLPESPGRTWYEADFDYDGGYRNNCRLLYSNDGLLFVTYDHYMSYIRNWIGEHYMNTITLDFLGIKSYWELHEYFKDIFRLPDYYGHNMDALWDCLYCCYDCSTTFVLKNLSAIPKELTPEIKIMLELFRDLAQKDGVNIVIEHAEASDISDYLI